MRLQGSVQDKASGSFQDRVNSFMQGKFSSQRFQWSSKRNTLVSKSTLRRKCWRRWIPSHPLTYKLKTLM
uniref:Uncharacterized protein n=1 Tax=Cucumis melo TaxID=3656 RepID=A0A9I9E8B1_CUCME